MDVSQIRSEFMIYIVDDEESIRSILVEALGSAGYQTENFPDAEKALAKIEQEPPHVVISDIRMPGMSGIDLLGKVKALSEDIQFIIMTSHASLDTALQAIKLGAYDYLHKPFEDIGDVLVTMDRTIEMVYLQFENEQLLSELDNKNKALTQLNSRIAQEKEEVVKINNLMAELSQNKESQGVIDLFLKHSSEILDGAAVLFFKYLPNYRSFVLSGGEGIDTSRFRSAGLSLNDVSREEQERTLDDIQNSIPVAEMLSQVFQVSDYLILELKQEGELEGFFVFLQNIYDVSLRRLIGSFLQATTVAYENAVMTRKIHDMAIKDPLTSLYNRRYFNERLEEEIQRSRRTRLPVSLIYLDIDHFKKYNDQNGHQNGDVLLKQLSAIMKKTSRANDVVTRLGGEEFCILLPHTDKNGAALKAEKLRRIIEGTKFAFGEKQPMGFVSISLGVSEYPSHCHDGEELIKSADDALYHVKETTRNMVCMASVSEDFKIDFEPLPVPEYKGIKN